MIKKVKKIFLFSVLSIPLCFGIKHVVTNNNLNNIQKIQNNKISTLSKSNLSWTDLEKMSHDEIMQLQKYDGRDYGIVPSFVENQGNSNLCWAYSTAAISEISILRKGIQGKYNQNDLNFFEDQIDYVTSVRTVEADRLGLTKNDIFSRNLNEGGSTSRAAKALSKWTGPMIMEKDHWSADDYKKYVKPEFLLQSYERIKTKKNTLDNDEILKVKKLIAKYGAVSFAHFITYANEEEYVLANYENRAGHVATIVGWDDTISKDKFKSYEGQATRDGAWIVRNSWGKQMHNQGYFYMSYDSWLRDLVGVDYVSNTEYENNYFYDGIISKSDIDETNSPFKNKTVGAIFPTKKASYNKKELLKGVMVGIKGENVKVDVKVYNGVSASLANRFSKENIPNSGTLVASKSQTFENEGVFTIKLDNEIELETGKNFSIVVNVSNKKGDAAVLFSNEPESYNDLTFIQENEKQNEWKNTWNYLSPWVARVGALTITEEKLGVSNNDLKYADVELVGNSFLRYGDDNKPSIKVIFDGKELKENVDYNVNYELDTNKLETSPSKDNFVIGGVQVVINGINNYKGINKSTSYPLIIGKSPQIPLSIGKLNSNGKVEITVGKNITNFDQIPLPMNWKWAYSNISIDSEQYLNYNGTDSDYYRKSIFDIVVNKVDSPQIPKIDIVNANINLKQNSFIYNGGEIKPSISVNLNNNNLQENIDYVIEYSNNIEVGNGIITIVGIGKYVGQKNIQFIIEKAINNIVITNNNGLIEVDSTFGTPIIKYYSDPNCKNEISKPATPGKYYVKASVEDNKNWTSATSSVVELIIENNPTPPVDPNPPVVPTPPIKPDNENKQHSNSNAIIIASIVTPISLIVVGGIIAGVIILRKKHNVHK